MGYRILVPEVVAECGLEDLRRVGFEVKKTDSIRKEDLIRDLQGCDGVVMQVAGLDADVLSANPQLKASASTGWAWTASIWTTAGPMASRWSTSPTPTACRWPSTPSP